jgi:hypothetical protein
MEPGPRLSLSRELEDSVNGLDYRHDSSNFSGFLGGKYGPDIGPT